jgi:hypothetical protein
MPTPDAHATEPRPAHADAQASTEERLQRVDAEIVRLWRERHRLAGELYRARVAAHQPGYRHAERTDTYALFVEEFGADYGGQVATLLLRRLGGRSVATLRALQINTGGHE